MSLRFDNEFLRTLEHLHMVSRRALGGQLRAERAANERGRGIEFADHRPYSRGDDFRHIDWPIYRRTKHLLIRLFDEERDLPIYLFVDASRSMADSRKFDVARQTAAALCYIGLVRFDRVTILPFGATLGQEILAGRARSNIFRVFRELEALHPTGETHSALAFRQFVARRRARGVSVVISDCLDPGGIEAGLTLLAAQGHDVLVIHLFTKGDRLPGQFGAVTFVDAETGEPVRAELTAGVRKAYTRAWDAHAADLEAFCGRYQLGYLRADVDQPVEDIVLKTFRRAGVLS